MDRRDGCRLIGDPEKECVEGGGYRERGRHRRWALLPGFLDGLHFSFLVLLDTQSRHQTRSWSWTLGGGG